MSEWVTAWIWELLILVLALAIISVVVIGPNARPRLRHYSYSQRREAIGRVLADLPSSLVTEVIVVDSNSNDGTPDITARMGVRVVQEPCRGYGRACLTGLAVAGSPDVVVFHDGDYSDRPSQFPILLASIAGSPSDITLGSRLRGQRSAGAMPWHQAFGNPLAATLIRLLFGLKLTDLGPFRAGRRCAARARSRRDHLWLGS
jgi:glycosyltransferase involved in cell wall biosynthesis